MFRLAFCGNIAPPPPTHGTLNRIQVVNQRLGFMPVARDPLVRTLHYRRFRNGLLDMSVFTHDDEVALMQQLPYIIGRSEYNRDSQLTRRRGAALWL